MRERIARVFGRSGLASTLLTARRWLGSPLITILTYHRAADARAETDYDSGVIDVSPASLDRHLAVIREACTPIGLEDLFAFVGGAKLPPNPVLVTFDDGYLDNHDVVLPILQRHRVRATFFIATSYIEERRLFWWDRINLLVKRSTRPAMTLAYPEHLTFPLATAADRKAAIRALLRVVKDTYALDLERFLAEVADASGVALDRDEERRRVDALMMTWDHVRALRRAGMDVASHTRTHRVVQTLEPAALADELAGSRRVLEGVLGEPVRAISYPVGKPIRETPHVRDAVRAAGYELGFSNSSGVNDRWTFDPFDAKRLSVDGVDGDAHLRGLLAAPILAYSSRAPSRRAARAVRA